MTNVQALELIEEIASTGGFVHGIPASKMLAMLKASVELNIKLIEEQKQFPSQGGKQTYKG
jgi:hypothetical protein